MSSLEKYRKYCKEVAIPFFNLECIIATPWGDPLVHTIINSYGWGSRMKGRGTRCGISRIP